MFAAQTKGFKTTLAQRRDIIEPQLKELDYAFAKRGTALSLLGHRGTYP